MSIQSTVTLLPSFAGCSGPWKLELSKTDMAHFSWTYILPRESDHAHINKQTQGENSSEALCALKESRNVTKLVSWCG